MVVVPPIGRDRWSEDPFDEVCTGRTTARCSSHLCGNARTTGCAFGQLAARSEGVDDTLNELPRLPWPALARRLQPVIVYGFFGSAFSSFLRHAAALSS